jgi:hypothetical protein
MPAWSLLGSSSGVQYGLWTLVRSVPEYRAWARGGRNGAVEDIDQGQGQAQGGIIKHYCEASRTYCGKPKTVEIIGNKLQCRKP